MPNNKNTDKDKIDEEIDDKFQEHLFLEMENRQPLDSSDRAGGYWNVGMVKSYLHSKIEEAKRVENKRVAEIVEGMAKEEKWKTDHMDESRDKQVYNQAIQDILKVITKGK